MGRILTNNTALSAAAETSVGVAGTDWFLLEPNDIGTFGASISTVTREPISKDRARRKGTIVDLDSAVEFEADLTMSSAWDFMEAFMFATSTNADVRITDATATLSTGFNVTALSADAAAKLNQFHASGRATLVHASGFTTSDLNGTWELDGAVATAATLLPISTLPSGTAQEGIVEIAGVRTVAGDITISVLSSLATITSTDATAPVDFRSLGLTVGQQVHIGGLTSANRPNSYGYGRVTLLTASAMYLDKIDATLVTSDGTDTGSGGTAVATDILFGQHVRNVSTDEADFLERSYTFELAMPNLEAGGGTMYEYALGNYANELTLNVPLAEKATLGFGFIGTDTDTPVASGSRKSGASAAVDPALTEAINTSADVLRLRVADVDENAMTSCFKDFTLTLNNNVSPEKCIGTLGAEFMNTGNFMVDLEAEVLFTDVAVAEAIRNNTTVSMDLILRNNDGAIGLDIPSMTLGDGAKSFPVNESVTIALSGMAFNDPVFGTSLGISTFPTAPTA